MDQSNTEKDDFLRATALTVAVNAHSKADGFPEDIIVQARQFYLFLTHRDPCVDLGLPDVQDESGECKVISIFEDFGLE